MENSKKRLSFKQELLSIAKLLPDDEVLINLCGKKNPEKTCRKLPDCGEDEMCWMENSGIPRASWLISLNRRSTFTGSPIKKCRGCQTLIF
jgi:hypothetical protein